MTNVEEDRETTETLLKKALEAIEALLEHNVPKEWSAYQAKRKEEEGMKADQKAHEKAALEKEKEQLRAALEKQKLKQTDDMAEKIEAEFDAAAEAYHKKRAKLQAKAKPKLRRQAEVVEVARMELEKAAPEAAKAYFMLLKKEKELIS